MPIVTEAASTATRNRPRPRIVDRSAPRDCGPRTTTKTRSSTARMTAAVIAKVSGLPTAMLEMNPTAPTSASTCQRGPRYSR